MDRGAYQRDGALSGLRFDAFLRMKPRVAVIGGGWAGLAAAVSAVERGASVTLIDMAPQLGGRARRVEVDGMALDNGQHILIGAYAATLDLMRTLGVDVSTCLQRGPLQLVEPDGRGLRLKAGPALPAFAAAVMRREGWSVADRLRLLATCVGWQWRGFECDSLATVESLCAGLPERIRRDLIEPLCVAALNTEARDASATVFLRVLRDSLAGGRGAADLLLPRVDLGVLMADPARRWLAASGVDIRLSRRVMSIEGPQGGDSSSMDKASAAASPSTWLVDGEPFDAVLMCTTAVEASRLASAQDAAWAAIASALRYEPIVTVYARAAGLQLPLPMLALEASATEPAQFVFDRGLLSNGDLRQRGLLAFVISGAAPWVSRGAEATIAATLAQALRQLGPLLASRPIEALRLLVDKRATFACTPNLARPRSAIAPGWWAGGDYVDGPYPATLEAAVRSGRACAAEAMEWLERKGLPAARR